MTTMTTTTTEEKRSSIWLKPEVKQRLEKLGNFNETYNDIVDRIITKVEAESSK